MDDILEKKNEEAHFFQIDVLKAIMIFLVIFDHTIPWSTKDYLGVALWERISIPVFLVIMGFNMGLSFHRSGERSLKKLYSWKYFKHKFWRFIIPFLILYAISTGIAILEIILNINPNALNQYEHGFAFPHLFIGILPFWGPGNWFIPVIFSSILVIPLLYRGFSGRLVWRILTLISCYLIELALQLFIFFFLWKSPFPSWDAYYAYREIYLFFATNVLFMLSAVGLGMWFAKSPNLFAKQNIFIWILFPLSLIYLIEYQFFEFRFAFIRGDYNLFVFPYSAFLILLAIKILPKKSNNAFAKGVAIIGKSTYHILLTQILYFAIVVSLWGDHYSASLLGINATRPIIAFYYLLINWAICIPSGVSWWYAETSLRQYIRKTRLLKSS
jgi:peptidoglycan/LPS O-acetylase OafA/YrhL